MRHRVTGDITSSLLPDVAALIALAKRAAVSAVDIPIGLTDAGPRRCDQLARAMLSPHRAASVFSAPLRPMLEAATRAEAGEIRRRIEGKSVSAQAWNICPRIREMDRLITPRLQRRVVEVHPEVSFAAWSGEPMHDPKKTKSGRAVRAALIDGMFGPAAREAARRRHWVRDVGHDDLHDAFAALWTAERIWRGEAKRLPESPEYDARGLRMEIVY